jgi:predicted SnoaL-like aldol condensation-catalyzing enzyme
VPTPLEPGANPQEMAVSATHGKEARRCSHGDDVTARSEQERANLRLVQRIYDEVLGPIDSAAVDALFDPGYIQHNPDAATGTLGLKAMLDNARVKYPNAEHRVKRMLVDGDLVAAHVHVIFHPGEAGVAVVDIFRIANGLIAEHWDVVQPVTAGSKNDNGRF